jgi:hypothetical protein
MGSLILNSSLTPPPAVETLATTAVEIGLKHRGGQPLGEDVSELGSRQDVEDSNISDGNALVDKVEINLNMLGALMLDGVDGEVDRVGMSDCKPCNTMLD